MTSSPHSKKVALVHDWLNGMRGGEKCLEVFCELYQHARLFTLFHERGCASPRIESMPITTSFIQKLPFPLRRRYPFFLPFFPLAIRQFDFSGYDVIFSSSHCVAKGARRPKGGYHVSYVHAPMRYVWDCFDIYFNRPQTPVTLRMGATLARPFLQGWDRKSSMEVDDFICNSRYIRQKIRHYYKREPRVIYPPVELSRFKPGSSKEGYYLMVGAIVPNKRVDLAVEAFNRLGFRLKIAGVGLDENYCRSIAGPNVEFLGYVDDELLVNLYQRAKALLFSGVDDFGIVPLEAQACGTPVIAFAQGGVLETVTERTGLFFYEPTVPALVEAVLKMEKTWKDFSPEDLRRNAARFGRERFKDEIRQAVEQGYSAGGHGRI